MIEVTGRDGWRRMEKGWVIDGENKWSGCKPMDAPAGQRRKAGRSLMQPGGGDAESIEEKR